MKRALFPALLVATAMSCALVESQPTNPPSAANRGVAQQQPPTPPAAPNTPGREVSGGDSPDYRPLSDGLLVLFNGILAYVTWQLWRVGERQELILQEMSRTFDETFATSKLIERAWISVETLEVRIHKDQFRTITVGLKNSGRTPAKILAANITVVGCVQDDHGEIADLEELPDVPVYDDVVVRPPAVLVAGEVSRMRRTISDTGPKAQYFGLLTARPGDQRRFWVYGFVRYTDGLSDVERRYGWVREYDPRLSTISGKFRFAHVNKADYNYAD
jgi:hypothetical protein